MAKSAPSPPPAPDPYATASAQTGANVNTAIANTTLQNANEIGPLGNVTYEQTGSRTIRDPIRDAAGNVVSGPGGVGGAGISYNEYDVPIYTRTTTLSAPQQEMLNRQQALGTQLLGMAQGQAGRVNDALSSPYDISHIQGLNQGEWNTSRDAVESAMLQRLNPQLERDKAALDNKLVNEGFQRGTEAYNQAMNEYGQQANDARLGVTLAGGQEQSRMAQLDMARRASQIQEYANQRQAPINEIGALMSGGQVQMPQFSAYNPGNIAQTPLAESVYRSADINQRNWMQESNNANATNAGLFGLGSSVVKGFFGLPFAGSDRRIKKNIEKVGARPDGLGIYNFEYIWGDGTVYRGHMADEVKELYPWAVRRAGGVDMVNYGAL